MSDSEKIKELEAMIVVLMKEIKSIKKKVGISTSLQSDASVLNDIKNEASKIRL